MRRIGNVLLWTGVVVGVLAGAWVWLGADAGGMPWLVGVGLIKLTMVAALALIAVGGVALRMANHRNRDALLRDGEPGIEITADRRAVQKERDTRRRP